MKIYRHPSSFSIGYLIVTEQFYLIVRFYRYEKRIDYSLGFENKFSSEITLIENGYQVILENKLKFNRFFIKAPFEVER